MQEIKEFAREVNENAISHGWWDEERSFGDLIVLCHSELSEAIEEFRNGHHPTETYYSCSNKGVTQEQAKRCTLYPCSPDKCTGAKPEGIPSELADVIIRVLDICAHYGIDIEKALVEKHEYNKNRPYRHGGKKI